MTAITNKNERVDAMCELIETVRDRIAEPMPDAPIVRECIDGILNTRTGKLLRSAPDLYAKPLANVFWYLVDWHISSGYIGTLYNCRFKTADIAKGRNLDITGAELYDMLETLAIVLHGGNSPASDRWEKALGRA
jgi:hypothetical protein